MIAFLTGSGALWAMTGLAAAQCAASLYQGSYPNALVMFGFVIADFGLIWSFR
jgi:hypothetical protein